MFCSQWYAWWKRINPEWREPAGDVLAMRGEGDWSKMFIPGVNGFVNVLGSLLGVRDTERNDAKWASVVRDVRWTVGQVLAARRCATDSCIAFQDLLMRLHRSKRSLEDVSTQKKKKRARLR